MPHLPVDQTVTWVYTRDLAATCRFYAEVLGLETVLDEGVARVFRIAGNGFLGVCVAGDGRVVEPKGGMVSFVTDDVDGWYERLVGAGVPTRGRPARLERFGIYTFFAEDPNGYTLEFQRFENPAWPKPE